MSGHTAESGLHAEDFHFQILVLRTLGFLKALSDFIPSQCPTDVFNAFIAASCFECVYCQDLEAGIKCDYTITTSSHQKKRTSFGHSSQPISSWFIL